jgi:hypothetical protein
LVIANRLGKKPGFLRIGGFKTPLLRQGGFIIREIIVL